MKVSDERAQTLREEYEPGDFYEARVMTELLADREALMRVVEAVREVKHVAEAEGTEADFWPAVLAMFRALRTLDKEEA